MSRVPLSLPRTSTKALSVGRSLGGLLLKLNNIDIDTFAANQRLFKKFLSSAKPTIVIHVEWQKAEEILAKFQRTTHHRRVSTDIVER